MHFIFVGRCLFLLVTIVLLFIMLDVEPFFLLHYMYHFSFNASFFSPSYNHNLLISHFLLFCIPLTQNDYAKYVFFYQVFFKQKLVRNHICHMSKIIDQDTAIVVKTILNWPVLHRSNVLHRQINYDFNRDVGILFKKRMRHNSRKKVATNYIMVNALVHK